MIVRAACVIVKAARPTQGGEPNRRQRRTREMVPLVFPESLEPIRGQFGALAFMLRAASLVAWELKVDANDHRGA